MFSFRFSRQRYKTTAAAVGGCFQIYFIVHSPPGIIASSALYFLVYTCCYYSVSYPACPVPTTVFLFAILRTKGNISRSFTSSTTYRCRGEWNLLTGTRTTIFTPHSSDSKRQIIGNRSAASSPTTPTHVGEDEMPKCFAAKINVAAHWLQKLFRVIIMRAW